MKPFAQHNARAYYHARIKAGHDDQDTDTVDHYVMVWTAAENNWDKATIGTCECEGCVQLVDWISR